MPRRGYKLPIAINPLDRRFLGTGGRETHRENLELLGLDEMSFFGDEPAELPRADVRLKEGDHLFDMDLVVLETPGHTPGSVCFYAEKEGILFSGDTLFFDGVGRTDLPGGSEKKLRESIQRKIAVLPPETRVFAGHGPFTTIERERRGNPFFRQPPAEVRPAPRKQTEPLEAPQEASRGKPQAAKSAKPAARESRHPPLVRQPLQREHHPQSGGPVLLRARQLPPGRLRPPPAVEQPGASAASGEKSRARPRHRRRRQGGQGRSVTSGKGSARPAGAVRKRASGRQVDKGAGVGKKARPDRALPLPSGRRSFAAVVEIS